MGRIGVITAMDFEGANFRRDDRIAYIRVGVGQTAGIEQAVQRLAQQGSTLVVSFGTAGGLWASMTAGQLCLPTRLLFDREPAVEPPRDPHLALSRLLSAQEIHRGPLLQTESMVHTTRRKRELAARYNAVAVDMESYDLARACIQTKIPFAVVRCIIDEVNDEIPEFIGRCLDSDGNIDKPALTRALALNPGSWPRLATLGRRYGAARRGLRLAADALIQYSDRALF